ncbi:MAG: hypothetical protein SPJ97_06900 [Bacteroides sp.]|nr:hypothetical protein [Bacteroides sp.]
MTHIHRTSSWFVHGYRKRRAVGTADEFLVNKNVTPIDTLFIAALQ